jgi:hypothetical protein
VIEGVCPDSASGDAIELDTPEESEVTRDATLPANSDPSAFQ